MSKEKSYLRSYTSFSNKYVCILIMLKFLKRFEKKNDFKQKICVNKRLPFVTFNDLWGQTWKICLKIGS